MNKILLAATFTTLLISACAREPIGLPSISGNVTVINEYGSDITKYCRKTLNKNGHFAQNASVGSNNLQQITCVNGHNVYRIKGDRLSISVPSSTSKTTFGAITITLNKDASYQVTGGNGQLKVGNTSKGWSKAYLGGPGF